MIVKNESHIIEQTFNNILSYVSIDYYVICDTGSTDNTIQIIKDFFSHRNIDGKIYQTEWHDFGTNRSIALEKAYKKTDYLIIFDADDKFHGKFKLPSVLDADKYDLKLGSSHFSYKRPLILNNKIKWKFNGILHEYLVNIDPIFKTVYLDGDYFIESGRKGGRSKLTNKYKKDAQLLDTAYYKEKDEHLKCRYAFYAAQSYKDDSNIEKSIEWYERVLTLNNWVQEKYYSCIMLGQLYIKKENIDKSIYYYLKSIEYDATRIEGIVCACEHYYSQKKYLLINLMAQKYKNVKTKLEEKLFLILDLYNDQLDFYNSISAYYVHEKESGYQSLKKVILNNKVNNNQQMFIYKHIIFYKDQIIEDTETYQLFLTYTRFMHMNKNIKIDTVFYESWNILFSLNKKHLTNTIHYEFKNNKTPIVFLSMTTCKRFDLFTQTLNSILKTWNDKEKIDYWFIVDDNSSKSEKEEMKKLYPWVDYYFKDETEKGHAKSMHIIYNKLQELKPKYWIHLEDDFLFFEHMNYIEKAIEGLDLMKEQNVKQICFNRSYAETIDHYNIQSHTIINDDFSYHIYDEHKKPPYSNCYYWPHYSFRPSLILTDAIFKIGNYDNEGFIEMNYAKKWSETGFKTGFFNKITNIHIGRLTKDRFNKIEKNAYELNNTEQFAILKEEDIVQENKQHNLLDNIIIKDNEHT